MIKLLNFQNKKINEIQIKFLIYSFVSIISLNFLFFSHRLFERQNGYILGDWLINYSGGFTRRGFFGETVIFLSNFLSVNLIYLTYFFFCILYVYFVFLLFKIISKTNFSFLKLIIVFSPATFLFAFYDPLAAGRKEFLFFLFFCLYFLYREKKFFIFFSPFIVSATILTHELFAFLVPFLIISRYVKTKSKKLKDYNYELFISTLLIIVFLFIYIFSDANLVHTCNTIKNFGYNSNLCLSINELNHFKNSEQKMFVFSHYISDKNYVQYYLSFLILSIFPIFLFLKKNLNFNFFISTFLMMVSFLPFLILFYFVNDWGRYIHIYTFLWMLIFLSNKETKKIDINISKILIVMIFSISWYIPHCCPEIHFSKYKVKPGIFYLYERIHLRLTTENDMYK